MHTVRLLFPSIVLLLLVSCAEPVERRIRITKSDLLQGVTINSPTRIHHMDGSVFLANQGFSIRNDTIVCSAQRYDLTRTIGIARAWVIPVDSIVGAEYFTHKNSLRDLGNTMIGITVTAYTVVGSIVVFKAIFGSCPTFYTTDGGDAVLQAEGFSYSIGKYFETPDLDRLQIHGTPEGPFGLSVRNEALETHYLNQVELWYADHSLGTRVYPGVDAGEVHVMMPKPPVSAVTSERRNVLAEVFTQDGVWFESRKESVMELLGDGKQDFIECEFDNLHGRREMTIVLRGRNSLQNTVLLYDVMMRNQGPLVMDWLATVNEDPLYAWRLYRWYREHSGIQVSVERDGTFEPVERIPDTGPIAWKETAIRIPVDPAEKKTRVRFSFQPESWNIDWIGFDDEEHETVEANRVSAARASSNMGLESGVILDGIRKDDDSYLVTGPGTEIQLGFDLPPAPEAERTLFVWSKGYYIEWVRGEWLKARDDVIVFDIGNPRKISKDLAEFWEKQREDLKERFYAHKIPLAR